MDALWLRIETVLSQHAQPVASSFRPPATLKQLEFAQQTMGAVFPEEVRNSYLRHDGCEPWSGLFPFGWWCSLDEMVTKWRSMQRLTADLKVRGEFHVQDASDFPWDDLTVRPEWWCDQWIPIAVTNTITGVYVDLLPAPSGIKGQLLSDDGMGEARVLATSLTVYLTTMATRYEQGHIVYDEGMKTASGALITYWDDLGRNG